MSSQLPDQPASKSWSTTSFLVPPTSTSRPNALVVLNSPLAHDALFRLLWAASSVRYCADGGANRLYERFVRTAEARGEDPTAFLPDLIKGDLDSLRPHVREFYASHNVPIIHDPDQDSTDLGKCIASLVEHELAHGGKEHQLILSGGLSGRLDQTVHTMHALTLLGETREYTWAVGAESVACVLTKGRHEMVIDLDHFGDTCGVLPVGEPARVKTTGLKWDLGPESYAYPTSVATAVSSSNHLPGEHVKIETDVPVVWTFEVRGAKE